jgi:hypothetical protein
MVFLIQVAQAAPRCQPSSRAQSTPTLPSPLLPLVRVLCLPVRHAVESLLCAACMSSSLNEARVSLTCCFRVGSAQGAGEAPSAEALQAILAQFVSLNVLSALPIWATLRSLPWLSPGFDGRRRGSRRWVAFCLVEAGTMKSPVATHCCRCRRRQRFVWRRQ